MYKESKERICENCGNIFLTLSPKQRYCRKACHKKAWKKKVQELGHTIYQGKCGVKKGTIPWNKNKKCPQLSGENNGFYHKQHTKETLDKIKETVYKVKSKNNSFNISKEEQQIKDYLLSKFSDLKCQYKSEEYPFACDFYIPSLKLYIEYQGHWTHGIYRHKILGLFDPLNLEHQNVLKIWKDKHTKYFDRAIKTWTELDPLKQQYIDKNKLNLLKFYTLEEFMEWFNKLS